MFRERLLRFEAVEGTALAKYLTSKDEAWVRALLEEFEACIGKPKKELAGKVARVPSHGESRLAREGMVWLLGSLHPTGIAAPLKPSRIREVVFEEAARDPSGRPRGDILREAARILSVDEGTVEGMLYADLPGERVVGSPASPPRAGEMIERYNLTLAQGMLLRAQSLRVGVEGQAHSVVRFAKLQRLICTVEAPVEEDGPARLALSGPLSLFRHTAKYGRAMSLFLPALTRAPRWSLEADCVLRGERLKFRASFRDPIGSTHAVPREFDSRLEERFFKDMKKLGGPWEVYRESVPIPAGRRILFPDFTLLRSTPRGTERLLVEIAGFWSPRYLAAKLAGLREAGRRDLLLLAEDDLCVEGDEAPPGPLFRFHRRIDAAGLVEFVEEAIGSGTLRPFPCSPGQSRERNLLTPRPGLP